MEEPINVMCPWCGEGFITFFDLSSGAQSYIEDCQICCQPINLNFRVKRDGSVSCQSERA